MLENNSLMNKTLLFLFSGKAGVGKTFSSNHIVAKVIPLGYNANIFSFATGVKNVAKSMGWDGKKDQRGRRLLQQIGQVGRAYDADMWVSDTLNRIHNSILSPYDILCIDDVRFPNEYTYIRDTQPLFKTVFIRIQSPEREILKGTEEYNEISEISLDNSEFFDYVVQNPVEDDSSIIQSLNLILGIEILKNR